MKRDSREEPAVTTDKASHLSRLAGFLKTGIWRVPAQDLPKSKAFLLHELRVLVLAARGFNEDKCHLRASALTFYSLLSLVPLLALAFGVSTTIRASPPSMGTMRS